MPPDAVRLSKRSRKWQRRRSLTRTRAATCCDARPREGGRDFSRQERERRVLSGHGHASPAVCDLVLDYGIDFFLHRWHLDHARCMARMHHTQNHP